MSSNKITLFVIILTVAVSGCTSPDNNETSSQLKLEKSTIINSTNSDVISVKDVKRVPKAFNNSNINEWRKTQVSFEDNSTLNYSFYKFETEKDAYIHIKEYWYSLLERDTHPTISKEFNGFEIYNDIKGIEVFGSYGIQGRYIYGIEAKSNESIEEEIEKLNQLWQNKIENRTRSTDLQANTEILTVSLRQMPEQPNSLMPPYKLLSNSQNRINYDINEEDGLTDNNILEESRNTFVLKKGKNKSEYPSFILSSVTLYKNKSIAKEEQMEFVESLRKNSTSYKEMDKFGDGKEIRFEPRHALKNTIVLGNVKNLNFQVITSGQSSYFSEIARRIYAEMYIKIPREVKNVK